MAKPTRWGFMGCGRIAYDFATAMKVLPKGEHEIVAVSAGNLQRAQEFAKKFGAKYAFEGYEKLAACPEVDIVYVNGIHPVHMPCTKLALNAGKPVLCEKPIGMNKKEVDEVIKLARQKDLFLMEAFWPRCFPIYDDIRQALKQGKIGEPRVIQGTFGFEGEPDRLHKLALGGGAILDIGCYLVMESTLVFDQRPQEVHAWGTLNKEGCDLTDCISLKYATGAYAQLMLSLETALNNTVTIYGSNGKIELPNPFFAPEHVTINSETIKKPLPESKEHFIHTNSVGLSHEASHVRQCLLKGLKESPFMSLEHTEIIISVMDEIRRQVGVVYAADKQ